MRRVDDMPSRRKLQLGSRSLPRIKPAASSSRGKQAAAEGEGGSSFFLTATEAAEPGAAGDAALNEARAGVLEHDDVRMDETLLHSNIDLRSAVNALK